MPKYILRRIQSLIVRVRPEPLTPELHILENIVGHTDRLKGQIHHHDLGIHDDTADVVSKRGRKKEPTIHFKSPLHLPTRHTGMQPGKLILRRLRKRRGYAASLGIICGKSYDAQKTKTQKQSLHDRSMVAGAAISRPKDG